MQRLIIKSLVFCLSLFLFSSNTLTAQWDKGISGEGPIVEKELTLDKFTGFDLAVSGNVFIQHGNSQKVRVEGQQNVIDNLKTEVRDGVWHIRFKQNMRNYKKF